MSKEALIEIAFLARPVNDISGTQPDRPDRSKPARPTPGSPGARMVDILLFEYCVQATGSAGLRKDI